jgi:acetyl esterase/lipase
MNVGYVATMVLVTVAMVLSAVPLRRPRPVGVFTWLVTDLANESPSLAFGYLLLCSFPALVESDGRAAALPWFALACASFLLTPVLVHRAALARPVLEKALGEALGPLDDEGGQGWRRRLPWLRIAVAPLPVLPWGVRRRRGLRYGPHRRHRLDVYTGAGAGTATTARPVLIHLHGGAFRSGRKSLYARPLLHAFARHGWVCVSPSYRLRPASYSDMLADVHAVIAWVRRHAGEFGADRDLVVLAGSSAGAHLAVTAALTGHANDLASPMVDTTVAAVIGLYGYYGPADRHGPPSQPSAYAHTAAPPVMIVHGAQDTLVPPGLHLDLVAALRATSTNPVVHAELPGAQHSFDLLHSWRFEQVIDAIWSFTTWVIKARATSSGDTHPSGRDGAEAP